MAKKKRAKRTDDEKAITRKIYADTDSIELLARKMYNTGKLVSVATVYHSIKDRLRLPGNYNFAAGDAIRDILREAGWEKVGPGAQN